MNTIIPTITAKLKNVDFFRVKRIYQSTASERMSRLKTDMPGVNLYRHISVRVYNDANSRES